MIANARTVMMAEVLPDRGYVNGNVGILLYLNVAKLLAPLLGGILVNQLPARTLYFLAASFYLLAVLSSTRLDLPERVRPHRGTIEDEEGIRTMEVLGENMAWLLKIIYG